jgi:hypothetical protein
MTDKRANKIYDILVNFGGAQETEREEFVYHHTVSEFGCQEWRFRGSLGFGGKYRSGNNRVDCYKEDATPERLNTIQMINALLEKINC